MMKKLFLLIGALALVCLGLVGTAGQASAHTPSISASCAGVDISATAYDAGRDNTWTVTIGGDTQSGTFGASFAETFPVPQGGATTAWSARIAGWDGNYDTGVVSGNVGPCGQAPDQCADGTNPGDLDGDGTTDAADCGYVAPQCPDGTNPGDLDGDGTTDAADCGYVAPQCADGTNPGDLDGDGTTDAADCGYVAPDDTLTQVTFCHATGSATNPFVQITTSVNAFYSSGHIDHAGDIWAAFSFVKHGDTIDVPAQGDPALLAAGCAVTSGPGTGPGTGPGAGPGPGPGAPADQCANGTNPGDVDGDGDEDRADCRAVLDESDTPPTTNGTRSAGVAPATTAPVTTRAPSALVPTSVNSGLGETSDLTAAFSPVPTTGRPFSGGPVLVACGAILLAAGVLARRTRG